MLVLETNMQCMHICKISLLHTFVISLLMLVHFIIVVITSHLIFIPIGLFTIVNLKKKEKIAIKKNIVHAS